MKASLAELEAIAAVARHGGFRAAARELGMSSSALSHAVAALEERLSVRIFNRTTRSVTLSDAGERFIADIAPALAAIDTAIENAGISSATVSGTLRLNMAPGAARMLLVPLILEYGRRYPDVEVEIVTEKCFGRRHRKGFRCRHSPRRGRSDGYGRDTDRFEATLACRRLARLFQRPTAPPRAR